MSTTEIVVRSTFNPAQLRKLVDGIEEEMRFIQGEELEDDEDEEAAAGRILEVKALAKKLRGLYDDKARPHLDALARLRELFKPFENPVAGLLGAYTGILGAYAVEKAKVRREAQELARKAAATRDTAALTTALNVRRDAAPQKLSGVSSKVVWVAEITEPSRVPRQWCKPDEKAIDTHAASFRDTDTPTAIPGVTFSLGAKQRVGGR